MARKKRSLKLLRLARDKKSLIWQKRYLTKLFEQQYYRLNADTDLDDAISKTPNTLSFELKVR